MSGALIIMQVHVHVLAEHLDAFVAATLDNAHHSVREPGVIRFDVLRHTDDPTRFSLIEIYRDAEAPLAHKQTAHYLRWRDAVASMMASPRTSVRYDSVFPAPPCWEMPGGADAALAPTTLS